MKTKKSALYDGIIDHLVGLCRSLTPSHSSSAGFGKLNKSLERTNNHSLLITILQNYRLSLFACGIHLCLHGNVVLWV